MTKAQPTSQPTQPTQPTDSTDGPPASIELPVPPPPPSIPTTWPPQYGQPSQLPSPPQFGRIEQLVPPPQFGRLARCLQLREPGRLQESAAAPQVCQEITGAQAGRTPHTGQKESPPRPTDVGDLRAVGLPEPLAGFGARAISFLIDYVAPVIVLNLLFSLGVATGSAAWRPALAAVGYLGLLGFAVWNSGYLQGTTGCSLGRRVARTKLVKIETGRPVGFGHALARQICHGLEFGIGYLWPLWDGKRQTFADKILKTVVIRVDPQAGHDAATKDRTGSATP